MRYLETVIQVTGLEKSYGKFRALDGLDLEVAQGEVMGFLGPNGSGKSTTIRILLGLLKADAGVVNIMGQDPWRNVVDLHRRLAYVPGDVSLWPTLTGGEAIDLLAKLRGGQDLQRRADLIEKFDFDPTKRGRQYSKGNRQKVAIIAALCANVDLLILDEPTSGLDPLMEAVFQAQIRHEKAQGRTILLSSHILSEAEALADRVSIIRAGKIVEVGTIDQLRSHTPASLQVTLNTAPSSRAEKVRLDELLKNPSWQGATLSAGVDRHAVGAVLSALMPYGITNLTVSEPSLEDLFLSQYEVS